MLQFSLCIKKKKLKIKKEKKVIISDYNYGLIKVEWNPKELIEI